MTMTAEVHFGSFEVPAQPAQLHVEVCREEPGAALVVVRGELDRASVPILAACLDKLFDAGLATVVVNLASVSFVDVGGINLLLEASRRALEWDISFCLAGCSGHLVRLMQRLDVLDAVTLIGPQQACGAHWADTTEIAADTVCPASNAVTPQRGGTATTATTGRSRLRPAPADQLAPRARAQRSCT
jgi:anti-anti-sigma factor